MTKLHAFKAMIDAPDVWLRARVGWRAFSALVNARSLAATFYVCFLLVMSRQLTWLGSPDHGTWWFELWNLVRFALVSGGTMLLTLGLAEAALASWESDQSSWWLIVPAVGIGSAAGLSLRVAGHGFASWGNIERGQYISLWVLWCVIGMLGIGIYRMFLRSRIARDQLAASRLARFQLEAQVTEAHLAALQAQIEPHFLFNTLANVKRLYDTDVQQGRTMLGSLIAYLRAALPSMREAGSTVARELELARAYLTILQMRMGARLAFDIDCDPSVLGAKLPPMMLPTLVENAVKHGLGPLPEGGHIRISVMAASGVLKLRVADDGAGFTQAGGTGIGLANIRARLVTLYGRDSALTLCRNEPRGVSAGIDVPLMFEAQVDMPSMEAR